LRSVRLKPSARWASSGKRAEDCPNIDPMRTLTGPLTWPHDALCTFAALRGRAPYLPHSRRAEAARPTSVSWRFRSPPHVLRRSRKNRAGAESEWIGLGPRMPAHVLERAVPGGIRFGRMNVVIPGPNHLRSQATEAFVLAPARTDPRLSRTRPPPIQNPGERSRHL